MNSRARDGQCVHRMSQKKTEFVSLVTSREPMAKRKRTDAREAAGEKNERESPDETLTDETAPICALALALQKNCNLKYKTVLTEFTTIDISNRPQTPSESTLDQWQRQAVAGEKCSQPSSSAVLRAAILGQIVFFRCTRRSGSPQMQQSVGHALAGRTRQDHHCINSLIPKGSYSVKLWNHVAESNFCQENRTVFFSGMGSSLLIAIISDNQLGKYRTSSLFTGKEKYKKYHFRWPRMGAISPPTVRNLWILGQRPETTCKYAHFNFIPFGWLVPEAGPVKQMSIFRTALYR